MLLSALQGDKLSASGVTVSDKLSVVNNLTQSESVELQGKGGTGVLSIVSGDSVCAIPTAAERPSKIGKTDWCHRVLFSLTADELSPLLQVSHVAKPRHLEEVLPRVLDNRRVVWEGCWGVVGGSKRPRHTTTHGLQLQSLLVIPTAAVS